MKVALSLEVTDAQRRELACRIAGKSVARLATRDDVRAFVEGAVASLSVPEVVRRDAAEPDAGEQELVERLRSEGKSEGYIKGYVETGRKIR